MTLTRAGEFGYPGLARYLTTLESWFYGELQRAYDAAILPDGQWRLCLGVLVYGGYVERFLDLCVPSLIATGNLEALPDPRILIHTDAASVPRLEVGLDDVRRHARVEIVVVPDDLLGMIPEHEANKYWLLGAAGNLHIQAAKYRAHAYHMLMPDHVYSTGYFAGLRRLAEAGKRAIVQGGLSAVIETAAAPLRQAGCALPSAKLNALALDHLHSQMRPFLMNERSDLPGNVFMLFVGDSEAVIASPHRSIVYLAHDVLMAAPLRLFNTIDAQLPFFIPDDVEFYVPQPSDGMAYIELSDEDKYYRKGSGYTAAEFAAHFWVMVNCNRSFMRFFREPTRLELPAGYAPPVAPMPATKLSARMQTALDGLDEAYDMIYHIIPPELRIDPIERQRQLLAEQAKGN